MVEGLARENLGVKVSGNDVKHYYMLMWREEYEVLLRSLQEDRKTELGKLASRGGQEK